MGRDGSVPLITKARRRLHRAVARVVEVLSRWLPRGVGGNLIRWLLLRLIGAQVAWPLHIDSDVWIRFPERLQSGRGLVLSRGSVLNCSGGVRFGDGCLVGYHAYIGSNSHIVPESIESPISGSGHEYAPVEIEDGCWIGAHACVLPGVRLRQGCVVGAGAVVTRDFEAGSIVAGVPAQLIRTRSGAGSADVSSG